MIDKKGKKAIEKKGRALKALSIELVDINSIKPNEYNPNRQSDHDFNLLCLSIQEDGFTQPIIVQKSDKMIVDGYHRWRAMKHLGHTEIPVVFVDMTAAQRRIATLRHNRARGSEEVELTAQVLRELQELGALEWAQDSLQLDDTEIERLLEDIDAPDALAGEEYGEAWEPQATGDLDADLANRGITEAVQVEDSQGGATFAMTTGAIEKIKDRETQLASARNAEERQMIQKDGATYKINLIFSGEEAKVIKAVLGKRPAQALLALCQSTTERKDNA